jgi:transcriptional regulator with XRE-family HTH domain
MQWCRAMEHPLKTWRAAKGLSLRDAAVKLNLSRSYLQQIEAWQSEPALSIAYRLSRLTRIPINRFLKNGHPPV